MNANPCCIVVFVDALDDFSDELSTAAAAGTRAIELWLVLQYGHMIECCVLMLCVSVCLSVLN